MYSFNSNQWTWLAGDDVIIGSNDYALKGIPSDSGAPGGRESFSMIFQAKTNSLLLFGGYYHDYGGKNGILDFDRSLFTATSLEYYNDVWQFNLTSYMYTWQLGDSSPDMAGRYGTKGIASTFNHPGARGYSSTVYHPGLDAVYTFGGEGFDILSNLSKCE
jgi:hypothetical protein